MQQRVKWAGIPTGIAGSCARTRRRNKPNDDLPPLHSITSSVDRAPELTQKSIPGGLHDPTTALSHLRLDHLSRHCGITEAIRAPKSARTLARASATSWSEVRSTLTVCVRCIALLLDHIEPDNGEPFGKPSRERAPDEAAAPGNDD